MAFLIRSRGPRSVSRTQKKNFGGKDFIHLVAEKSDDKKCEFDENELIPTHVVILDSYITLFLKPPNNLVKLSIL